MIIQEFPNIIKSIAEQTSGLGNFFTQELANINGVSITPLLIILPTSLIAILTYVIVRFLTI